jgi:hypothetical protein
MDDTRNDLRHQTECAQARHASRAASDRRNASKSLALRPTWRAQAVACGTPADDAD